MSLPTREQVEARSWYHTIELAPGLTTPGYFDHREVAQAILPHNLAGKRCLDVATFDGFWALEMNRRGAREVIAVDVADPQDWDWPAGSADEVVATISARKNEGDGFLIVKEALGHDIERKQRSVYDLDPDEVGMFEFIYVGSLLLHLRDPVRALERVRSVCSGEMLLVDNIDPVTTLLHRTRPVATFDGMGRPWWWKPNVAALERMVASAGWDIVGPSRRVKFARGTGRPVPKLRLASLRNLEARIEFREALLGDPHAAVHARPRPGI